MDDGVLAELARNHRELGAILVGHGELELWAVDREPQELGQPQQADRLRAAVGVDRERLRVGAPAAVGEEAGGAPAAEQQRQRIGHLTVPVQLDDEVELAGLRLLEEAGHLTDLGLALGQSRIPRQLHEPVEVRAEALHETRGRGQPDQGDLRVRERAAK